MQTNLISFSTPRVFGNFLSYPLSLKERLSNIVENYFYLNNTPLFVIQPPHDPNAPLHRQVELISSMPCSRWMKVLKICSYFTLAIPVIMLITKFILRQTPYVFVKKLPTPTPPSPKSTRSPPPIYPLSPPPWLSSEKRTFSKTSITSSYSSSSDEEISEETFLQIRPSERYFKNVLPSKSPPKTRVIEGDLLSEFERPSSVTSEYHFSPLSSPYSEKTAEHPEQQPFPSSTVVSPYSKPSTALQQPIFSDPSSIFSTGSCASSSSSIISSLQNVEDSSLPPSPPSPTPYAHKLEMPDLQETSSKSPLLLDEKEVTDTLEMVLDAVSQQKAHPFIEIKYFSINVFVSFELPNSFPGIIFKTNLNRDKCPIKQKHRISFDTGRKETLKRFDLTQQVIKTVKENNYTHLYIPSSRLFRVHINPHTSICFIADQKISLFSDSDSALVWKIRRHELQPAFNELASLIHTTGLWDIKPNNCSPFPQDDGEWGLALIDIEYLTTPPSSSDETPTGLIQFFDHLYSRKNMEMIIEKAPKKLQPNLKICMEKRLQELMVMSNHEQFHIEQKTHPHKCVPIEMNEEKLQTLGLNLDEVAAFPSECTLTMREAVLQLVDTLNESLTKTKNKFKTISHRIRADYRFFPYPLQEASSSSDNTDLNSIWVRQILTALQQAGHIFSWEVIEPNTKGHLFPFSFKLTAPLIIWV